MSIENSFTSAPGYPTLPQGLSASGRFYDMKNSISFSTDILLPAPSYRVTKFSVDIDRTDKSSPDNVLHKPYDLLLKLQSSETTNNLRLQPTTISTNHCDNVTYPFVNGNTYRILYEIYVSHVVGGVTTKYKLVHTQYFTYFANPVTLSDFQFNDNVEERDPIYVSGLLLVPPQVGTDNTVPEDTADFGAVQFTFQEAEPCSGSHTNNQPTEPYIVDMSYNPLGEYTLQPNASYSLQSGKIYKVDAEANWALGYSTFTRSSQNLYILNRPVITSIDVKPLVTEDRTTPVVDITTEALSNSGTVTAPSKIWFEFYDSSDTLVAITGGNNGIDASGNPTSPGTNISINNEYSFGLDEIYTLGGEGLIVDTTYKVKAVVRYAGESCLPNIPQWRRSDEYENVIFDLVTPVISSISPYDIQNDGGEDGVPAGNDADSASQIVATVTINNAAYELYAPSHIRFNIYNSSGTTKLAETTERAFTNSLTTGTQLYDILLSEITLIGSAQALTNGTPYKVKAEVRLLDHDSDVELRESQIFTNLTFSQNIAPVPSVVISNSWALATNNNPSSSPSRFNGSPLVGISGYFMKTAQFGSSYSKQLDVTTTEYLLEYNLNGGSSWNLVTKAVLIRQNSLSPSPSGTFRVDVGNAHAIAAANNATVSANGRYSNVVGDRSLPIIFHIPQDQGSGNAFTEADTVKVRVTVIDTTGMWSPGNDTSSPRLSNSIQLIKRINSYDFSNGTDSEPWNSQTGNQLVLNIPVDWKSIHAHSVKVGYKYSSSNSVSYTYETFNSPASSVSINVDPSLGTTLYYSVAYIVNNVNLSSSPYTTQGLTVEKNVQNKFFPSSSDYTVSNTSYKTFNSDGQSSIEFTLALAADSKNRMDGVNVYFESPSVGTGFVSTNGLLTDGSNIPKVRIGTYTTSVVADTITLIIDVSGNDGGILRVLNPAGTSEINFNGNLWGNYDMANITFEAYRDARVSSVDASYNPINSASDPVPSGFYVESGGQSTFGTSSDSNPIWNVLDLTPPSADANGNNIYVLSGGVINIAGSANHTITWPTASNNNGMPFTYDLKITENDTTVLVDEKNQTDPSYVIPIDLVNLAKYTIEITKVFNGLLPTSERELSEPDTVVFHSVEVDTSNMALSVQNPSNTSSVTLSWLAPDISGNSITESGFEESSSPNNIHAQYIKYRIGNTGNYARLDTASSASLIESSPSLYTLPNQNLGTLYDFVVYVEAQVKYTLNGVLSSTRSTPYSVPFTPQVPTAESKYIVSTIPSIIVPHTSPVLIQDSSNPTLLLDLNANGLEVEGFISVVVILTQDGTASKPEGEQALLIFPDSNNGHPFSFPNTVTGISGAGAGDIRLAGGDSATSFPRNELQPASSLSTQSHSYTLTIGNVNTSGPNDGRYAYSRLQMPSTANSGFVADQVVNYMVILTTRRGTDIGVGEFTYEALPTVRNVQIVNNNGAYSVQFDVNPA